MNDEVNHPQHYASGEVECIEIARHMDFNSGNAFKYLWRHPVKHGGIVDLQKANWYIDDWKKNCSCEEMTVRPPTVVDDAFERILQTKQFPIDKTRALMQLFYGFWHGDMERIHVVTDYIDTEIKLASVSA